MAAKAGKQPYTVRRYGPLADTRDDREDAHDNRGSYTKADIHDARVNFSGLAFFASAIEGTAAMASSAIDQGAVRSTKAGPPQFVASVLPCSHAVATACKPECRRVSRRLRPIHWGKTRHYGENVLTLRIAHRSFNYEEKMCGAIVRRLILLAGLSLFVWPFAESSVAADSQSQALSVRGYAQSVCTLAAPQISQSTNITISGGTAIQIVLNVPALVDEKTAQLRPGSVSLTANLICNRSHSLRIVSGNGGLRPQTGGDTPAGTGFANRIDYTVNASWGGATAQLQTSGVGGAATPEVQSPGAYAGNLVLQVSINESGAGHLPLVAGNYTDALTITLSPL